MRQIEISPTPSDLFKLKEKVAMRHAIDKNRMSQQKMRIISLYEKIESANQSDPLYTTTNTTIKKISENKKKMRATQTQNQMLDRYSLMVNTYIQQIDNPIKKQNSNDEIRMNAHKMSILKNLLSKYNSRFLGQNNYHKLINSFGLQIQPMKNLGRFRTTQGKTSRARKKLQKFLGPRNQLKCSQLQDPIEEEAIMQLFEHQSKQLSKTAIFVPNDGRSKKFHSHQRKLVSQNVTKRYSCPDQAKITMYKDGNEEHNFENRLCKYRQFLYVINLSNNVFRNIEIQEYKKPLKFYVGNGNNCNLIKSIMRNRFWFEETNNIDDANFVWTQIKVQEYFSNQDFYEDDIQYPDEESQQTKKSLLRSNKTFAAGVKKGVKSLQPQIPELKLLSQSQYKNYIQSWKLYNHKNVFQSRLKAWKDIKMDKERLPGKLHNHLPRNELLGNKKAMFYCLREYYTLTNKNIFDIVPLTFHIQNGVKDPQYKLFLNQYNRRKIQGKSNIWIIKPGESTNRGNGISCSKKIDQIKQLISRKISKNQEKRTFILQSYLTKPLLYHRRKFDIRAYMLITGNNGRIRGYWYQQGYVRTSSSYFDLGELDDPMIHLTNDAVQKNGDRYGRYQAGNKITYNELQRYIESIGSKIDFFTSIYPEMRRIAGDSIRSTAIYLDRLRHQNNFQLFGLDFMIDEDYKPWLIEINTNPCLQLSCGILQRLIPHLVQNVIRITVDPVFPPPSKFPFTKRYNVLENALHYNKFELIFDEISEGKVLHQLYSNSNVLDLIGNVKQDQDMYEDDGQLLSIQEQTS